MKKIVIDDKIFRLYISQNEIESAVVCCAEQLNAKFANSSSEPIIISILNGAVFFTVDLFKKLDFMCDIDFVKYSSYCGLESTGEIKEIIGLKNSLEGRDVIVIDDIVDSGVTMKRIAEELSLSSPRSITVVAFIYKPNSVKVDVKVDFAAITMCDNPFIIGYGLDYNEKMRNLKDIYILD